jgi:hypothetical protein
LTSILDEGIETPSHEPNNKTCTGSDGIVSASFYRLA